MFKRILTVMLCFVLVLGVSSLAFAKTKGKVKAAKAVIETSEDEAPSETVVKKMSEPKDDLKEKLGLAFTTSGTATMRMWLTNSMGLDLLANIGVNNSVFGMGLGANIVFPIMENSSAAFYMVPGMKISFDTSSAAGSNIRFDFVANLEAEAFIVRNLVSVGGTLGLDIGINVNSPPAPLTSSTNFILNLGSFPAALFVRVYM